MAILNNLTVNDTGFVKIDTGTSATRPVSPTRNTTRFNSQTKRIEVFDGASWNSDGLVNSGLSQFDPALSGQALATAFPELPSGYYWIQSSAMPNPLQMYVDMSAEGGGFDFYPIQNGTAHWAVFAGLTGSNSPEHSGIALGLDLWYPRSKYHWQAATNFVGSVLGETASNYQKYFQAIPVYRTNSTDTGAGDGQSYTSSIMRNPKHYGSGVADWRVPDGGRWWLRDTVFIEPNGDYLNYGLLGTSGSRVNNSGVSVGGNGYLIPEPYNLSDIQFNDIAADRYNSNGTFYLVSTNAKT